MIPENRAELFAALDMHISACKEIKGQLKRQTIASDEVGDLSEAQQDAMISRLALQQYVITDTEARRIYNADTPTTLNRPSN